MPELSPRLENTIISVEGVPVYVKEPIGVGGFATVYRASSDALYGQELAVKACKPQVEDESAKGSQPFDQEPGEFKALHMLREHPGIAKLLLSDVITDSTGEKWNVGVQPYYVGTLREWIRSGGASNFLYSMRVIKDLAAAVEHVHANGLVHRDIKPQNILLRADGRAVLGDFGLVVRAQARKVRKQLDMGTVGYAAPEHVKGQPTFASDQYSLAVTVCELLTGTGPMPAFAALEAMALSNGLLAAMAPAIRKAHEYDEKKRYLSVTAFAHDLEDRAYIAMGAGETAKKMFPDAWARQRSGELAWEAQVRANSGAYNEALAWYESAIAHDPTNAEAHFRKGRLLEKWGHMAEARTSYMSAYNCPLKVPADYARRGIIAAGFNWHAQAVEHYEKARAYGYATLTTGMQELRSKRILATSDTQPMPIVESTDKERFGHITTVKTAAPSRSDQKAARLVSELPAI
jgi:hypothetical protein